ncbi:uncharacterized protein LOC143431301 [Xylocopa sonorina]|uniref:uncharacterized protein LOC143431301 n=1 Tax=Xylocopa sonorina TaxID=1818115 RepID=UPI00403AA492
MDSRRRYLEMQLQRRESEASELRRNLRELGTKFFQLERAFEINLQSQARQEVEFNRMKLESEGLQKLNDEIVRARTELNSRLMNAITERDHWKNAFLQQSEVIKRNKKEFDHVVVLVKSECEGVLKITRETAEKQFQEIAGLYHEAKEKVIRLEEQIRAYRGSEREYENRSFQLANLLETLKRFDVDVGSVCQLTAEALKNLTERGNLYEESMKNLRHLAWTIKDRKDEPQLILLREQNSVLREVVKNLKRKFQTLERTKANSDEYTRLEIETNSRDVNNDLPIESMDIENTDPTIGNSTNALFREENSNYDRKEYKERGGIETRTKHGSLENDNRNERFDIESAIFDKGGKVLCIESHSNGARYEEYVFKLSIDREMKIKYPVLLNDKVKEAVYLEFVDDEVEYEKAPLDRMLILFKNICAVISIKQTGISCSTQTMRTKTINNSTQTVLTGLNSFSRLNVGAMVSEQFSRFLL